MLESNMLYNSQIFWFGDLNYRLYVDTNLARQLIKKQDWRALQEFDQLQRELEHGGVFQGWKEGNIKFAPTYKYSSSNCNRYSGGLPSRAGEKQRTPAWYGFSKMTFANDANCTYYMDSYNRIRSNLYPTVRFTLFKCQGHGEAKNNHLRVNFIFLGGVNSIFITS